MSARFQELDWRETPMGALSLRRRRDPTLGADVYEIKLDDDYLMSSIWTAGEVALARLGLAEREAEWDGGPLDVLVGGLGLGYTAQAVLADARVTSLVVVEALAEVIDWHERKLVPLGEQLTEDPRCRLTQGDFFAIVGTASEEPGRRFHAILVDIDHSPRHVLHPAHASFYRPDGLRRLAGHLHPGGVFALWSTDPPDGDFVGVLRDVFGGATAHVVDFPNPVHGGTATNTVYVASV